MLLTLYLPQTRSEDWVRLKLTSIMSDVTYLFTVCKLSNLLTLPILNFKLNNELKESLVLRKAVNSRILRCTPQWTFMKSSARLLRMGSWRRVNWSSGSFDKHYMTTLTTWKTGASFDKTFKTTINKKNSTIFNHMENLWHFFRGKQK